MAGVLSEVLGVIYLRMLLNQPFGNFYFFILSVRGSFRLGRRSLDYILRVELRGLGVQRRRGACLEIMPVVLQYK